MNFRQYVLARVARNPLLPTPYHLLRPLAASDCCTGRYFSYDHRHLKKYEPTLSHNGSEIVNTGGGEKRQDRRAQGTKTSLRRVAVEAERSRRDFIKGRGRNRFIDPRIETKKVTAYCAAEQYNISTVAHLLRNSDFVVDPYKTGLYPQVVHVQPTTGGTTSSPSAPPLASDSAGDLFIFPSGTVVAWNVPERIASRFVSQVLPPAAQNSHLDLLETEDLGYLEDPTTHMSVVVGDTILLGTGSQSQTPSDSGEGTMRSPNSSDEVQAIASADKPGDNKTVRGVDVEVILAKIAFSSGLARSTKLSVLETLLSGYFESTRSIPTMLSRGSRLPFTRSFILRKTGELLNIRAQLNLYSELTDSLPDLFWDSKHELGLEGYYDQVGRALDIGVRIKVLNEKMDYAQEIASVLRERLSETHGLLLEWLIIALISVEVILEFWRHWKEKEERLDPTSTESLLRQYLRSRLEERPPISTEGD